MELLIILIFVVGYLAIALEHPIKINKTASALLTAVICWTIFTVSGASETLLNSERYLHFIHELGEKAATLSASELHLEYVGEQLGHHLNEIAQILFFLMGAMTIVELVDAHHGFKFITDRIKTKNPIVLLWVVCLVAFFLSSVLDNLTTTIVMVSLIRKLIPDKENYDKFHLENVIDWWRKKAANRFETLTSEGRIRNETEVWTGDKEIDIIR